jgi:hypothetical protein
LSFRVQVNAVGDEQLRFVHGKVEIQWISEH